MEGFGDAPCLLARLLDPERIGLLAFADVIADKDPEVILEGRFQQNRSLQHRLGIFRFEFGRQAFCDVAQSDFGLAPRREIRLERFADALVGV